MPDPAPTGQDPGKQSRASEGIPVIPSLDGFRTLTVFTVIASHAFLFSGTYLAQSGTTLGKWLALLQIFVDAFFIISGFVLFLPTVVSGGDFGSVKAYAIRRAARVVPAYWLAILLVLVLIAVAPPHAPPNLNFGPDLPFPGIGSIVGHLAFLQTPLALVDSGSPVGFGINGPVWTLSLEIVFYLVLPFIARPYFRHPWIGLAITAAIAIAWHAIFANFGTFAPLFGVEEGSLRETQIILQSDYQLPGWAFSFGAGMTAAWVFMYLRTRVDADAVRRWASIIQPIALVAVLVAAHLCYRYGIIPAVGFEPPTAAGIGRRAQLPTMLFTLSLTVLMMATAFARPIQQALFSNRPMTWLADVSYGTYLAHFVVMTYLLTLFGFPQDGTIVNFLLWFAVTLPIAVVYGYLSARFLERPIRRWAHRYGRTASTSSKAVAPVGVSGDGRG